MKLKDILDNTKMISTAAPYSIIHFLGEDLTHSDVSNYISNNTLCFELSPKVLLVTDIDRNYLFTYRSYCSEEFCFCSKGGASQVHHENLRKFRYVLWEKFMDSYYQINEYEEVTEDTEIDF
ncbi:hypothetical protein vBAcePPAc_0207 [Aeromonas phage vB_AceP_PAc]|nr:hypothetical protein vBAcePPAc_0207 [Aeromonas phage vB_AceP_PAc]